MDDNIADPTNRDFDDKSMNKFKISIKIGVKCIILVSSKSGSKMNSFGQN